MSLSPQIDSTNTISLVYNKQTPTTLIQRVVRLTRVNAAGWLSSDTLRGTKFFSVAIALGVGHERIVVRTATDSRVNSDSARLGAGQQQRWQRESNTRIPNLHQ